MKFSISIPAFKKKYLNEAINSVLSQTYTDWEMLIIDDCSPENLESVIESYLSDERIKYYKNAKNCGAIDVVDNWNICLSHCTGDYVICMGDDDCLLPCCLDEYSKLISKFPGLNVYHCRTQIINDNNEVIDEQELRPEWESDISLLWNRWNSRDKQFIGDFCYDVKYLKSVGGYYKLPLAWGSDDITAVRAAVGCGIANTPIFCFQYRENDQTITKSGNALIKMDATIAQYRWFADFLEGKEGDKLSDDDNEYLQTIDGPCRLYYYRSVGQNCVEVMRGNPFKIVLCMKKLKVFNYPKYTFMRFYITSLKNRLLGK